MGVHKVKENAAAPEGGRELEGFELEKWEKGMEVAGVVERIEEVDIGGLFTTHHVLISFPGESAAGELTRYACPAILKQRLDRLSLPARVVIRCGGKNRETGKGVAWDFKVWELPN